MLWGRLSGRSRAGIRYGLRDAFGTVLGVGIRRREGFGATTERQTISAQDIGFFDVSIGAVSDGFGVSGSQAFGAVLTR